LLHISYLHDPGGELETGIRCESFIDHLAVTLDDHSELDEAMILIDSSATDAPWRAQSSWHQTHRRAKSHHCSSEPIQVGELAAVHGDGVDHLEEHGIAVGGDDEEAVEFLLPPGQHR